MWSVDSKRVTGGRVGPMAYKGERELRKDDFWPRSFLISNFALLRFIYGI